MARDDSDPWQNDCQPTKPKQTETTYDSRMHTSIFKHPVLSDRGEN